MTKEEIIEYLYENNVRGDLTIEQMAEEIADTPQTDCEGCDRYEDGGELCDMCALEKGKKDAQTDCGWK